MTKFVDRDEELKVLTTAWESRPSLVIVYGRRRVGKTALIQVWLKSLKALGVNSVYYHAVMASHEVNLRSLASAIEEQMGLRGFSRPEYPSLDALLESLAARVDDAVLVIDEFTYWVRAAPRVVSELQKFVDQVLHSTKLLVVLVGSLVGVMFRSVLGGGAPLYGRARLRLRVRPLKPWYIPALHPWLPLEDVVHVYALLGGVPYYHAMVGEGWSVKEVVEKLLASPLSPLVDEPWFILREEFRNPHAYYSILEAIAEGYNTVSRISEYTGIPRHHITRYLRVLEELEMVEHVIPLGCKRGWYTIKDPVLRTWFKLVKPNIDLIQLGVVEEAVERITSKLEEYTALVFEEVVAKEFINWLLSKGLLKASRIGKYLHKGVEIDFVAVDEKSKRLHAFEVKWSKLGCTEARRVAKNLMVKAEEAARRLGCEVGNIALIVRGCECKDLDIAKVYALHDMPFEKPR